MALPRPTSAAFVASSRRAPRQRGMSHQRQNRVLVVAALIVLVLLAAGAIVPALVPTRPNHGDMRIGNAARQIAVAAIHYEQERGAVAGSIDELVSAMDLPPKLLVVRHAMHVQRPHFLYLRPTPEAPPWQPLVVSDPACSTRGAVAICHVDGSLRWLQKDAAARSWREARRIAALPQAAGDGLAASDCQPLLELSDPGAAKRLAEAAPGPRATPAPAPPGTPGSSPSSP